MSLFAHLALQFGTHPENLATEGLAYILGRSVAARSSLLSSLGEGVSTTLPADLRFHSQPASAEEGRPDLAGVDDLGHVRVLVEAKFWAGLTHHQPVGYLDQLAPGGVLIVIGPSVRLGYLWRELLRRLREAGRACLEKSAPGPSGHLIVADRHLVLSSWQRVLHGMRMQLSSEPHITADVAQLEGLCARMDTEAFVPLTSSELTSNSYRRVHEFGSIVDEVAAQLTSEGVMTKKGVRSAAANGWYGRYVLLRGVGVLLHVSTYKWTLLAPNPVWLTVYGSKWHSGDPAPPTKQLAAFELSNPGTVYADHQGFPTVMIPVQAGLERHELVSAMAQRLRALGEAIAPLAGSAVEPASPELEPELQ